MNPRRRFFVHRKFQADFALKLLIAVFVPVLVCMLFFVLYVGIWGARLDEPSRGILDGALVGAVLLRVLPVCFVIVVFSVLFSHRIAGPIRRMQETCADLAEGTPTGQIFLRKKDYLHGLAAKLNQLSETGTSGSE